MELDAPGLTGPLCFFFFSPPHRLNNCSVLFFTHPIFSRDLLPASSEVWTLSGLLLKQVYFPSF